MNLRNSFIHRIALVRTSFKLYTGAYLEFEIAGANKQISPVFLVHCFLYTISYKPILSVMALIKYTYLPA